jgi:hypothetical protein
MYIVHFPFKNVDHIRLLQEHIRTREDLRKEQYEKQPLLYIAFQCCLITDSQ